MIFLESVRSYRRPGTPARHKVSDLIIAGTDAKRIVTGKHWQEADTLSRDLMNNLEQALQDFNNARVSAASVHVDYDLRPEVANKRAAERRLKMLTPSLDALEKLCAGAVDQGFAAVERLESEIIGLSAPTPTGSDFGRLARVMLDCELRTEIRRQIADASKTDPLAGKRFALALLSEFTAVSDWDSFGAIENAKPGILSADFRGIRRSWAIESFPEIKTLLGDKTETAQYLVSLAGAASGLARVSAYRLTGTLAEGSKDLSYSQPEDVRKVWLKYGSKALTDGSRPIDLTDSDPETSHASALKSAVAGV